MHISILISALFSFFASIWLAGPSLYWLDSAEFIAASQTLGVAHSPGHPLASLLTRPFLYLPFGTHAFRITIASAFFSAIAIGVIALMIHRLIDHLKNHPLDDSLRAKRPLHQHLAVVSAALCAGFSYSLIFQTVRAEVYALNLMLIILSAYGLLRAGQLKDRRYFLAVSLTAGLGLSNHHLLIILAILGALPFMVIKRDVFFKPAKTLFYICVVGLLALSVLAYLPLRSAKNPLVNWGAPHTLKRFAWVVSAKAFHQSLDRAAKESISHRAGGAMMAVLGGLSPLGGLLAFAGIYFALRKKHLRAYALLLGGIALFNLISPLLVGFDPFNPDAHGYLSVAVALLSPFIGLFIFIFVDLATKSRGGFAYLALFALLLPAGQVLALNKANLNQDWSNEDTMRRLLDLPPNAILITSYYQSVFGAWAMQSVWQYRQDICLIHRNFLAQPGYVESLTKRYPKLGSVLKRWKAHNDIQVDDLIELAKTHSIFVEYDFNIKKELGESLIPWGLTHRFVTRKNPALIKKGIHSAEICFDQWHGDLGRIEENEKKRAVVWTHYLHGLHACRYGYKTLASMHLKRALNIAPKSKDLLLLAKKCLAQ